MAPIFYTRKSWIARCMNKKHHPVLKTTHILVAILLLALAACGPMREVVVPEPEDVSVSRTLSALKAGETSFDFFATRFSGLATLDNIEYNISGTIRIRRDSAIYISVSPLLGIEMARVLITPDEVQIINRMEGTYFKGEMGFVNNMLNTNLDFYMLQAMLVGNDFEHFSSDNFQLTPDGERLLLQNPMRYPIGKYDTGQAFQQNIWLDRASHRITETLIYEPLTRRSIRARYGRFEQITGQYYPSEVSLVFLEPGTRAELYVRYSRTSIDEPQPMLFSVPERYRPMISN